MKKSSIIILGIILLSFGAAVYFYPLMPERMASHWGFNGEVNGYISKFWGLFLMPLISCAMFLLFWAIPKLDPLKANIEKFRKYFDGFIISVVVFLFYIYLLTIFWNLGARFNIGQLMAPAIGALFYCSGFLMAKAKRNYFIGIRTPWTLSNDVVWDKTHKVGGKLFKTAGSLAVLGVFFPDQAFFLVMIPILAATIFSVVYSYVAYRQEIKN
ncbi:MAG: SdpI family protein [Patescibacteria group bacterium]|nr:SdpI family protein [Patescibacteria group bacterium]